MSPLWQYTLTGLALALSAHSVYGMSQRKIAEGGADWATVHMQQEHHTSSFDATSFFTLHDFDSDGFWSGDEIQRLYGLGDQGAFGNEPQQQARLKPSDNDAQRVAQAVLDMCDENDDGRVALHEWIAALGRGDRLPDFGFGPGHHGDDEYAYEVQHFEARPNSSKAEQAVEAEGTEEQGEQAPPEPAPRMLATTPNQWQHRDASSSAPAESVGVRETNIPVKFRREFVA